MHHTSYRQPSLDMKFFESNSSKEKFRRIQALEEQVRDLQSKLEEDYEDMIVKTQNLLLGEKGINAEIMKLQADNKENMRALGETGIKADIKKLWAADVENMRILTEEMNWKTGSLENAADLDRQLFGMHVQWQSKRNNEIHGLIDQGRHAMNQVQRDVKKLFKLIQQTRRSDHEEPSRFYTFPDDDDNWDLPVAIRPAKPGTHRA
jgi:hypothetical protein